ncbi:unnamed protein product [Ambrosiozyma monospora]|uniref:Vacuolar protein sorting-associated protein 35 n=1 Tax=Ambrosiozyma monospora TaxID=43982 RepID=A0A9W6YXP5_AMBMO|nr:unnamed protein product [Ambrosiozyma monospora]
MPPKSINITTEEQKRILENSSSVIKQQIAQMKKCLETKNKFMDSLKHVSNFLTELKTSALTPKQYYELYILAFDGLEYFSDYLKDNRPSNHLDDLYELVQYAGAIVPRLYLMITVGTVYMTKKGAPVKDIMKDMMEMCRGVQHPIRGLFLRYFLSQRTKDLLPATFNKDHGSGDLADSIQFIITNFIEMNKLWVRLQHQGHSSERLKRIAERQELQILVGSNLVRLSQLEEVDKNYYKKNILPTLLEQIIQCRDVIAQEYLLDVIIQVFPDDFHLITLDDFFEATLQLNPEVSLKKILITLIQRLIDFKKREPDFIDQFDALSLADIFDKFISFINKLNELKPDLSGEDYSSILENLAQLSIAYYPNNYDNINSIYVYAIEKFNTLNKVENNEQSAYWKSLLMIPVESFTDAKSLLQLGTTYLDFFEAQTHAIRTTVSLEIIDKFLEKQTKITEVEQVDKIFEILKTVIVVQEDPTIKKLGLEKKAVMTSTLFGSGVISNEEVLDPIETVLQQEKLAKFIHLLYNKNPYKHFELLKQARQFLTLGKLRIKYTYPTLISCILRLIRKLNLIKRIETKKQKIIVANFFKFISGLINEMTEYSISPPTCLNYNLITAELADEVALVDIAYDFFIDSFVMYEQVIVDSRLQYQSLLNIYNKLYVSHKMIELNLENFNQLITKATLYGSKLLKKTDQCRAVYSAAHLWWIIKEIEPTSSDSSTSSFGVSNIVSPHISLKKDHKRVLECLQKALPNT